MLTRKSLFLFGSAAMVTMSPAFGKEQDKVDANGEKLICRRDADIGSLIPKKKRCYTKAEWEAIGLAARANATHIVQDGTGRPAGGP